MISWTFCQKGDPSRKGKIKLMGTRHQTLVLAGGTPGGVLRDWCLMWRKQIRGFSVHTSLNVEA